MGPRDKQPCASGRIAREAGTRSPHSPNAGHRDTRLSYACRHELLVHGLDEDGAATAVQAGAVCDLNLLHLAMRSCRQEHLLIAAEARSAAPTRRSAVRRAPSRRAGAPAANLSHVREL